MTALDELREFLAYGELSHEGKIEFDRLIAAVLDDVDTLTLDALLTDEAVDRALRVWGQEAGSPYTAYSREYLGLPELWASMSREEQQERKAALREADTEATRQSRDLMRRCLRAALAEGPPA